MSTIFSEGEPMLPSDPLDIESDWVCDKTGAKRPAAEVKEEMARIGEELQVKIIIFFGDLLMADGSVVNF